MTSQLGAIKAVMPRGPPLSMQARMVKVTKSMNAVGIASPQTWLEKKE